MMPVFFGALALWFVAIAVMGGVVFVATGEGSAFGVSLSSPWLWFICRGAARHGALAAVQATEGWG